MPPLLGLLPVRHRHGGNHHDRPGTAEPGGLQHQLGDRAGGQLLPHGQPPRHSAARLQGQHRLRRRRTGGDHRHPRRSADQPEGRRNSLRRCHRPTTSARRTTTRCSGYLLLFHEIGLDYTFSAYASEGGNFGLFTSHEMIKRLNAKIYAEAKRLGVKWILGGECGHMWRVAAPVHGHDERPGRFPGSAGLADHRHAVRECALDEDGPHLRVHRRPDPARQAEARPVERNDHWNVTFHDSCNPGAGDGPARGAALHPAERRAAHFHEMPENTIREQTFCCGSGAGLGTDENLEMRHARRTSRAPTRCKYVQEQARRQPAGLHLRHRQGHAAAAAGVLGPRRRGGRRPRTGRQRAGHEGREASGRRTCAASRSLAPRSPPMRDRHVDPGGPRPVPRGRSATPSGTPGSPGRRPGAPPLRQARAARETPVSLPRGVHAGVAHEAAHRRGATCVVRAGRADADRCPTAGRTTGEPDRHLPRLPRDKAEFCDRCHDYAGVQRPYLLGLPLSTRPCGYWRRRPG